jgi:hypothetical protein
LNDNQNEHVQEDDRANYIDTHEEEKSKNGSIATGETWDAVGSFSYVIEHVVVPTFSC